ncbi:hypothetical protein [Candidatus Magnetaquicoccus inordinatus]|uniref:hypothetical protein n=1 Tax=Candidatus Magnetaquicoccus inordinatus TaxID=2496818 RepID=UPI00102C45CD|nr:hypothetical protein [Candidatus Magnetaquicoccus inordinatus]
MPISNVAAMRADDLKQLYAVYGDFYQLDLGEKQLSCRVVLELVAHERVPLLANRLAEQQPDLLVVMMNPGSSKPIDDTYRPRVVGLEGAGARPERVLTRPDNTQYQVMRVMAAQGWGHARVFNLSDLREPKSLLWRQQVEQLADVPGGERHSLFCAARREERERLMGERGKIPVLVGWGRDAGMRFLAEQCLSVLSGWLLLGVATDAEGIFYAHPSPMLQQAKERWLAEILMCLQ